MFHPQEFAKNTPAVGSMFAGSTAQQFATTKPANYLSVAGITCQQGIYYPFIRFQKHYHSLVTVNIITNPATINTM
jgi:hypothetical protein